MESAASLQADATPLHPLRQREVPMGDMPNLVQAALAALRGADLVLCDVRASSLWLEEQGELLIPDDHHLLPKDGSLRVRPCVRTL